MTEVKPGQTVGNVKCSTCDCCMAVFLHAGCNLWICETCWFEHEGAGCDKVVRPVSGGADT